MPRKPKNASTICRSEMVTPRIVGSSVISAAATIKMTGTIASSLSTPRSQSKVHRSQAPA